MCTPAQNARKKLSREAVRRTQQAGIAKTRLDSLGYINPGELEEVLRKKFATHRGMVTDPTQIGRMAADLAGFLDRVGRCPENLVRFEQHIEDHAANTRKATELRREMLQDVVSDPRFREDLELLIPLPDVGVDIALTITVEVVGTPVPSGKVACQVCGPCNHSGYKKRATGHIYKGGTSG